MSRIGILTVAFIAIFGCVPDRADQVHAADAAGDLEIATFAGGCFWCMEGPFEKLDGVSAVISGYTGGQVDNPSYKQVSAGGTGHAEAIQVHYDPARIRYTDLLEVFWRQVDPTDGGGQFVDRGNQYRSEIFYHDESQREAAERSKAALQDSMRYDKPIVTPITPFERFWPAEDYHQDFYKTNPDRYHQYRYTSGRDQYLDKIWGNERYFEPEPISSPGDYRKPPEVELRAMLTPIQFEVTQNAGTEPPFSNEYWDHHRDGIYVDVVTGEPLFASVDKFKSGSGWPSFTRPLVEGNVVEGTDYKLGYGRTELRSKHGDSHLGHVFNDGPEPTGLRYCINSAALRFVPKEDLEAEGYGQFTELFDD